MDPLILIIEEIERIRGDADNLEVELTDCETRMDFHRDDPRYQRLLSDKDKIMKNLCDIRKELCQKGKSNTLTVS